MHLIRKNASLELLCSSDFDEEVREVRYILRVFRPMYHWYVYDVLDRVFGKHTVLDTFDDADGQHFVLIIKETLKEPLRNKRKLLKNRLDTFSAFFTKREYAGGESLKYQEFVARYAHTGLV